MQQQFPFRDIIEAAYRVESKGSESVSGQVELLIDGESVDSETVSLPSKNTETGELEWDAIDELSDAFELRMESPQTHEEVTIEIEPPEMEVEGHPEMVEDEDEIWGPEESDQPIKVTLENGVGGPIEGERLYVDIIDWRGVVQRELESDGLTNEDGIAYIESFSPSNIEGFLLDNTTEVYWTGDERGDTRYVEYSISWTDSSTLLANFLNIGSIVDLQSDLLSDNVIDDIWSSEESSEHVWDLGESRNDGDSGVFFIPNTFGGTGINLHLDNSSSEDTPKWYADMDLEGVDELIFYCLESSYGTSPFFEIRVDGNQEYYEDDDVPEDEEISVDVSGYDSIVEVEFHLNDADTSSGHDIDIAYFRYK